LGATFARIDRQNRMDNEKALAALQKQGIEFVSPSADQQQAWEQHANTTLNKLSEEKLFSKAMFSRMQALVQQYRKVAAAH
ncbi:MAG: hypothetical protein AB2615_09865, partial [Candidatus Thiodiazotropha sp.]